MVEQPVLDMELSVSESSRAKRTMKLITSTVKSRGVLLIQVSTIPIYLKIGKIGHSDCLVSQCLVHDDTKTASYSQFEVVVLLPVLLAGWWVFGYLGGLDWSSENSYKFNWHPLAMIIAFILLLGNAAVSYRLFPFGRSTNKKIHATLNLLAIVFIVFGLVAVLEYHADWGYNNFYSLHSWCGLVTLTAFIALALFSAAVFQDFDRTKLTELRGNFKPLHIFLGVFLVFSAVIAIETGIVEKAMFREKSGDLVWENYTTEGFLINLLCSSVLLVLLYTIYILYTLSTVIVQEPLFPHSPGTSRLQT